MLARLNSNISVDSFTPIVSSGDPSISRYLSSVYHQKATTPQSYIVSYTKFHEHTLPAPYNLGGHEGIRYGSCSFKCQVKQQSLHGNYYEFSEAINLLKSPILDNSNDNDVINVNQSLIANYESCKRSCLRNAKFYKNKNLNYTLTHLSNPVYPANSMKSTPGISFWFRSTDSPITITIFRPQFPLLDLLLYIGSIFCIWFGIEIHRLTVVLKNRVREIVIDSISMQVDTLKYKIIIARWALITKLLTIRQEKQRQINHFKVNNNVTNPRHDGSPALKTHEDYECLLPEVYI